MPAFRFESAVLASTVRYLRTETREKRPCATPRPLRNLRGTSSCISRWRPSSFSRWRCFPACSEFGWSGAGPPLLHAGSGMRMGERAFRESSMAFPRPRMFRSGFEDEKRGFAQSREDAKKNEVPSCVAGAIGIAKALRAEEAIHSRLRLKRGQKTLGPSIRGRPLPQATGVPELSSPYFGGNIFL